MILSKIKNILNNNNGMALIVALCVSTFIMALSLGVIYSTSQVSSNINNKMLREQALWQATTFADQLRDNVVRDDTQTTRIDKIVRDTDFYDSLSRVFDKASLNTPYVFSYTQSEDLRQKWGDITVEITKKELKEDEQIGDLDNPDSDWADQGSVDDDFIGQNIRYKLEVTVTVKMVSGVTAAVTDVYEVNETYDYAYYFKGSVTNGGNEIGCEYNITNGDYFKPLTLNRGIEYSDVGITSENGQITMQYANNVKGLLSDSSYIRRERDSGPYINFIFVGRE